MLDIDLSPELLLRAYAMGIFPMADSRDGPIHWYEPQERGIIEFDKLHITKNLAKLIRSGRLHVTYNAEFHNVITQCSETREETWISDDIIRVYDQLHELGFAHSIEVWEGDALAGGLYGVGIGGAFFGESMFHLRTDASKVALVYLVRHLLRRGYVLLDTQYTNPHLERMGGTSITQEAYMKRLKEALFLPVTFFPEGELQGTIEL